MIAAGPGKTWKGLEPGTYRLEDGEPVRVDEVLEFVVVEALSDCEERVEITVDPDGVVFSRLDDGCHTFPLALAPPLLRYDPCEPCLGSGLRVRRTKNKGKKVLEECEACGGYGAVEVQVEVSP